MGGHGAMYLAIRHPETFGTSVCLMGGVDIRPFPELGNQETIGRDRNAPGKLGGTHRDQPGQEIEDEQIKIVLDCGRGDFFLQVNRALHIPSSGRHQSYLRGA